jgi:anti-anti-sigma regulatory factor
MDAQASIGHYEYMDKQMVIDCGGVLDISVVSQWCEQAQAALQTGSAIHLKADDLQRIDAAGMQAVLSLFLAAKQREIAIQWDRSSPAVQHAAVLTGLTEYLLLA